MDERIIQFKAGQPIPEWDLRHRLSINEPVSSECKDSATIFRINSTYMDVTDQPFRERHWQAGTVIYTILVLGLILASMVKIHLRPLPSDSTTLSIIYLIAIAGFIEFARLAFKYGRDEFFALKRRPIRFNRREKKIYAIRHRRFFSKPGEGDITWEVPWNDKTIFCIHRRIVRSRHIFHIRHYEVDQNGNVIRAFAIGRTWEEDECLTGLLSQWNYWCWYMNHGPADLPKPLLFFKEKENALESFLFCLYSFGMRASAASRIAMMPFILLMTSHRLIALWTCRDPIWPDAVNKVSVIDSNDPFDEPSGSTPIGWAETAHALDRNEYPEGDKKEIENWSGEKDPIANALLWAEDTPPTIHQPTKAPHER